FSVSLSADGSTVAIGAPYNEGNGFASGHVRIYQRNSSTNAWEQLGADIDAEDAGDESGYSVSLSADGSTVAIAADRNDGNGDDAGHVRIYRLTYTNDASGGGDATPPVSPSAPDLTAASDTGNSDTDNLTGDTTPTFTGTAEAGTTVELFADGASLGTTTADDSGIWSFTLAEPDALTDGSYAITATATTSSATLQATPIARSSAYSTHHENRNPNAFAALKEDGSVVTWATWDYGIDNGGDSSSVSNGLQSGVTQIFSTNYAFAALKEDGSVITWGSFTNGGNSSSVFTDLQSGVTQISSTKTAFAALKDDGSVVTWGKDNRGGDSSSVSNDLQSGVSQIFSSGYAFAALKDDGSVVTWGGSVTWAGSEYDVKISSVSAALQSGVTQIFSTSSSFAALKEDGSVVTWGYISSGADSSTVSADLQSGVTQIFSTSDAFAALKEDGSVITWGNIEDGGDSSSVTLKLQSGVSQIFSSVGAFAALKDDGSVVTWGNYRYGGDSSSVSTDLESGVTQIFPSGGAFAALKEDGSVVTWGSSYSGGDSSSISTDLQSGVTQIFTTGDAFAALKEDGSVVTWGRSKYGGDSSTVSADLQSGVSQIFSTGYAFAALKDDGSVVVWGGDLFGDGDRNSVSADLQSGVVSFADPFQDDRLIFQDSSSDPSPALDLIVDTTAPVFTSADSASSIDENSGAGQVIYTASTTDSSPVTYSLKPGNNDDAASFSIDSTSGEVTLNVDPDYESQSSYAFTIQATDGAGNTSDVPVSLDINDLQEMPSDNQESSKIKKGTRYEDILLGTSKDDFLYGKGGDDFLKGLGGDDVLQGGSGNDVLKGSAGGDYLNGARGSDILIGGKGADVFKISKGKDIVQDFSIKEGDRIALPKSRNYEMIDSEIGVLITVNSKRGMLLAGLEYSETIAVGIDLFVQPV
ncbi:Ig-like domain-containing protein, partial [bacterium]|nr:Ig-like domain-containing protein [bacterium]